MSELKPTPPPPRAGLLYVHVRFKPRTDNPVRPAMWAEPPRCTLASDGTLDVRGQIQDVARLKRWLLGFGASAEVLAPLRLRRQLAIEARAMLRLYGDVDVLDED
jgi:hypothetical protein